MLEKLKTIELQALKEIKDSPDENDIRELEVKYLGRKGALTEVLRNLSEIPKEERPTVGKEANIVKNKVAKAIENKRKEFDTAELTGIEHKEWIDVTLPGEINIPRGVLHPITKVKIELEDVFYSMGFLVLDGPHVETEYNNFEALNIPAHHPARDIQDTFWCKDGNLLRTHTSPVQIRAMRSMKPPIKIVAPGRVFRYEATDASHENTFNQIEGLMIDKDISVAHLIYTMEVLVRAVLGKDLQIRLRPGYFPFVEPGFELDVNCIFCRGKGCSVCKRTGWMELGGCGLVHPNVLKAGNIDSKEYSGFAFGFGLERLCMLKYGIDEIRHFLSGDLRFLKQF